MKRLMIGTRAISVKAHLASGARYRPTAPILTLIIILFVSSLLYYLVLMPERFGTGHDDGIYATTAKALATGQGYRIISLPDEPVQTKYPPFYPLLLSLIWKAYPKFPENLPWMMMLSSMATLGFLSLAYHYLTKMGYSTKWQALIIVGFAGMNWRTMILATSIYAEMVYAALSIAALYLAEKNEIEARRWVREVLLGTVLGLAVLTRSSGLTLLIAVGLYYLLRRRWREALVVVGVGCLFVLGWISWCYANKSSTEGVNAAYYATYFRDISGMINGLQAEGGGSKIQIILTILQQNFFSAIVVSIPLVCSGLAYQSAPGLGEYGVIISVCSIFLFLILILFGFLRQLGKGLRLLHIYFLLYLAAHLAVPYISYDRYLMPMLPLLLLFLVTELSAAMALARTELAISGQLARKLISSLLILVVTATVCIGLYGYGSGIRRSIASLQGVHARGAQDAESVQWIDANSDPSEVLMCYRDPAFYLYTRRKAVPLTIVKSAGSQQVNPPWLLTAITRANAKYLVVTSTDFDHDYESDSQRAALRTLLEQYSKTFIPVFESTDGHSRIYRIDYKAT